MRPVSLLALGFCAGIAAGDAGPDFGKKYVPVRNVVSVHGGVTDTDFYTRTDRGVWKQVTFKPGEPTTLDLGARGGSLYLVPATVGKKFLLRKELTDELERTLLTGIVKLEIRGRATLPVRDKRVKLEEHYLIRPGGEGEPPRIEQENPAVPSKKEPVAARGRTFVAGFCITTAAILSGLVLSRRIRPEVPTKTLT